MKLRCAYSTLLSDQLMHWLTMVQRMEDVVLGGRSAVVDPLSADLDTPSSWTTHRERPVQEQGGGRALGQGAACEDEHNNQKARSKGVGEHDVEWILLSKRPGRYEPDTAQEGAEVGWGARTLRKDVAREHEEDDQEARAERVCDHHVARQRRKHAEHGQSVAVHQEQDYVECQEPARGALGISFCFALSSGSAWPIQPAR